MAKRTFIGLALGTAIWVGMVALPVRADKFNNTGPGSLNTCEATTQVGVSVPSRDSLMASGYAKLMVGSNDNHSLGARVQLNMPFSHPNGRSAFFENYIHSNGTAVLRVLIGPNNRSSNDEISSWNLANGNFTAKGRITSLVGFWVNSTQLNVPDYVFEPSYRLRSLEETDRFIQANRHLPDVPSAARIREEGMDLAEMNLKLLQKVEELTLHAIQQEKRIQKLEKRLSQKSS